MHASDASTLTETTDWEAAVSPADLAARSEIVLIMLPDAASIESALARSTGLMAGVHSPTTLILGTVCSAKFARDLGTRLHNRTAGSLQLVDAPLVGEAEQLVEGLVPILAGASQANFARALPVLEALGRTTLIGSLGAGQVAHVCRQTVLAAQSIALAEAQALAEGTDLDVRLLLNGSAPPKVTGTSIESMLHLVTSAQHEADRNSSPSTLLDALHLTLRRLSDSGHQQADLAEVPDLVSADAASHRTPSL